MGQWCHHPRPREVTLKDNDKFTSAKPQQNKTRITTPAFWGYLPHDYPFYWVIFGSQVKWRQSQSYKFITLRPRQNGRLLADDTYKRIFLYENVRISIKISLKFVPKGLINNIPELVLIMAWRRPGDKPLSEPMMVRSLTHICVTRPQWVKEFAKI